MSADLLANPDDSALGAALFLWASLGVAYLLWLAGHYAGRFHRAGLRRLARHRTRQETSSR